MGYFSLKIGDFSPFFVVFCRIFCDFQVIFSVFSENFHIYFQILKIGIKILIFAYIKVWLLSVECLIFTNIEIFDNI